jgi:hypothetical protein
LDTLARPDQHYCQPKLLVTNCEIFHIAYSRIAITSLKFKINAHYIIEHIYVYYQSSPTYFVVNCNILRRNAYHLFQTISFLQVNIVILLKWIGARPLKPCILTGKILTTILFIRYILNTITTKLWDKIIGYNKCYKAIDKPNVLKTLRKKFRSSINLHTYNNTLKQRKYKTPNTHKKQKIIQRKWQESPPSQTRQLIITEQEHFPTTQINKKDTQANLMQWKKE